MKNGSGASKATARRPIPLNLEVTIAKMIRAVHKTEQISAATNPAKKNHFISTSFSLTDASH
jgi:hypothetical protein